METWLTNNWWWLLSAVGGSAYIAYRVHRRGGDEALAVRVFYALAPVLDPASEERKQLTPRAMVLFGLGVVIALVAVLVARLFNP